MNEHESEFEPVREPLERIVTSFHLAPAFAHLTSAPVGESEVCDTEPIERWHMRFVPTPPHQAALARIRRFSVAEYHRLIEIGLLGENDKVELLEGYLVGKVPSSPLHDGTIDLVKGALPPVVPPGWLVRVQQAVTLDDSEPEPDFAAVRGSARSFLTRHPSATEMGLAIEVADSTLAGDRADKGRIYAASNIPHYWIVNLVDLQVECYSAPSGPTLTPGYGQKQVVRKGASVDLILDEKTVARLRVDDLLP